MKVWYAPGMKHNEPSSVSGSDSEKEVEKNTLAYRVADSGSYSQQTNKFRTGSI